MNNITLIAIVLSLLAVFAIGLTLFSSGLIDSIFDGRYGKAALGLAISLLSIGGFLILASIV